MNFRFNIFINNNTIRFYPLKIAFFVFSCPALAHSNMIAHTLHKEKKFILRTSDNLTFTAIMSFRPNAKGNIVLCHPASRNKEFMERYAYSLFPEYNHIRFDFRLHGEHKTNKKYYSTIGKKEAQEVAIATLLFKKHPQTKHLPIYGFGISMGAAALLEAEGRRKLFDGLILQSCFENLKTQIKRMYPLLHHIRRLPLIKFLIKKLYYIDIQSVNPRQRIQSITQTPIFLIHACNDTYIPITAFHELCKAGKTIIKTWTPEKGKHTELLEHCKEEYIEQCREFLAQFENYAPQNKMHEA